MTAETAATAAAADTAAVAATADTVAAAAAAAGVAAAAATQLVACTRQGQRFSENWVFIRGNYVVFTSTVLPVCPFPAVSSTVG